MYSASRHIVIGCSVDAGHSSSHTERIFEHHFGLTTAQTAQNHKGAETFCGFHSDKPIYIICDVNENILTKHLYPSEFLKIHLCMSGSGRFYGGMNPIMTFNNCSK